jgi:hypothetical protein
MIVESFIATRERNHSPRADHAMPPQFRELTGHDVPWRDAGGRACP